MTPYLRAKALNDLYPFGDDTPFAPSRNISHIKPVLESLLKNLGLDERLRQSTIFSEWQQLVGANIASHAQPVSIRCGTLVITVDHPVWLQELKRYHHDLMLKTLQQHLGTNTVRKLVFRIG